MVMMIGIADWLPPATIGLGFVSLACAKFYGLYRGIAGGPGTPLAQRFCGT